MFLMCVHGMMGSFTPKLLLMFFIPLNAPQNLCLDLAEVIGLPQQQLEMDCVQKRRESIRAKLRFCAQPQFSTVNT